MWKADRDGYRGLNVRWDRDSFISRKRRTRTTCSIFLQLLIFGRYKTRLFFSKFSCLYERKNYKSTIAIILYCTRHMQMRRRNLRSYDNNNIQCTVYTVYIILFIEIKANWNMRIIFWIFEVYIYIYKPMWIWWVYSCVQCVYYYPF